MKRLLTFLAAFGISGFLFSQPTSQTFTNPGSATYTVPAGYVANITVQAWGGGGGVTSGSTARGGGGGGGYSSTTYINVPAGNYTIVVGEGGGSSDDGLNSTYNFDGNAYVATGGERGSAGSGGNGGNLNTAGSGGSTANGGNGGNREEGGAGGGGGATGCSDGMNGEDGSDGNNGVGGLGGIGCLANPSNDGSGGDGGDTGLAGADGSAPGGGGGGDGDGTGVSAGNGAHGRVEVIVNSFVLPIELTYFRSQLTDTKSILLTWQTATEINNHYMVIERSPDGRTFHEIGRMYGAGTSYQTQFYQFEDRQPLPGRNHYRLRQVDYDGTMSFSEVISVTNDQGAHASMLSIWPTVAESGQVRTVDLSAFPEGKLEISIFHASGQLIRSLEASGGDTFLLPVASFTPALYTIKVIGSHSSRTGRFVVQ